MTSRTPDVDRPIYLEGAGVSDDFTQTSGTRDVGVYLEGAGVSGDLRQTSHTPVADGVGEVDDLRQDGAVVVGPELLREVAVGQEAQLLCAHCAGHSCNNEEL